MDKKITTEEFGATIKQKYPQYMQLSDAEVGQKMLAKYPQYQPHITESKQAEPKPDILTKVARGLDVVFGGGKVGEAIGTGLAKSGITGLSPEERKFVEPGPSAGEVAGSALQSAALFTPVGKLAGGLAGLASKAGLKTGVSAIGKIGSGAVAGGAFDVAQNLQEGETGMGALKPGLGAAIGSSIPVIGVAKNVTLRFSQAQAPRVINSLIKPLAKDFAYGKNPGRAVAEEKIVANNWDDLINKISNRRQEIGSKIGALGDKLEGKVKLNLQTAMSPLDDAMQLAASQNNPTVLNRLQNVKKAVLEDLGVAFDEAGTAQIITKGTRNITSASFKEARKMLGSIGDITQFTGNPSDDKIVNSALKQVYGKIKEITVKSAHRVDPKVGTEFEKLTERYADLSSAQIATKYRDKIVERSNLLTLSPQVAGVGTALLTFAATGGAATPAILAGLAGATLDKLATTPAFKTRLASILVKKSPQELNILFQKVPALQKFFPKGSPISPGDRVLPTLQKGASNINKTMAGKGGLSIQDVSKSPLLTEARKYKTAEEFVKKSGKPEDWISDKVVPLPQEVYRGTSENTGSGFAMFGQGLYTAAKKSEAAKYGIVKKLGKESMPSNPLQFKSTSDFGQWEYEMAKRYGLRRNTLYPRNGGVDDLVKVLGYDGVTIGKGRDMFMVKFGDTPSKMNLPPTDAQLTSIWEKAHKK